MLAPGLRAGQVVVFAAASLTEALKDIGAAYEKESGEKIVLNLAGSSTLARQIGEGVPADIFFSADEAKMDAVEAKGLIEAGTRRNRLSNSLVIVVSREGGPTITGPKDLVSGKVTRIALADPGIVPAGVYAKEYLEKQNLWAELQGRVIPTENVRGALTAVESGNVDAGIVYKTDAMISKKVKVEYEVPAEEGPKIRYPAAALKGSKNLEGAKRFLEYLGSGKATQVFEKYGFVVLK
jgi:molybdate transport system substrate-binding protein